MPGPTAGSAVPVGRARTLAQVCRHFGEVDEALRAIEAVPARKRHPTVISSWPADAPTVVISVDKVAEEPHVCKRLRVNQVTEVAADADPFTDPDGFAWETTQAEAAVAPMRTIAG